MVAGWRIEKLRQAILLNEGKQKRNESVRGHQSREVKGEGSPLEIESIGPNMEGYV